MIDSREKKQTVDVFSLTEYERKGWLKLLRALRDCDDKRKPKQTIQKENMPNDRS